MLAHFNGDRRLLPSRDWILPHFDFSLTQELIAHNNNKADRTRHYGKSSTSYIDDGQATHKTVNMAFRTQHLATTAAQSSMHRQRH